MRAIVQRVEDAAVRVENEVIADIDQGLLVFLGIKDGDTEEDISYLIDKIVNLRIFSNQKGKMDLSVKDLDLEVLVVPQFTLYGDCRSGKRPDFTAAASPKEAKELFKKFIDEIKETSIEVGTGEFGAMMEVDFINDGPVTIMLDSNKEF
ncbi:D-aminoacyl-tRNA deacylase [Acetohalobium arabaticum]|uniref:D-aminoacyl-tRNA deacylase n=1 Tax=Acetohalobium arabaticum (strain ATCC 49924 / DSM 5501 / Z-7288) TaxID=574087 RepID=D9QVK0_ACEAZ|nr:D-aminoacyl-tRNA deacylase [Acetohalobium arabaticum]ADL12259.1 D-tyrosyl-tRNA(Tyr) deacylase [Acetohalobium arabaticum DSM 5501]